MIARPFTRLLIANRGEIAARIVREAQALGLTPIVCVSDADAGDWAGVETARIGPAASAQSYLNISAILDAARSHRCEAVHPGYGFLSENAAFARAVAAAGLIFVGPSADAIAAMADKGEAKRIASEAGVPVIDGYDGGGQSDAHLAAEAERIGWPVLLKAALGGGGRGQRVVSRAEDFAAALAGARREALSAFGSDRMILEKALRDVRHVEVQVFGDTLGALVHLGDRDCSVQRRNQKIIEEAPAPGLAPATRARMAEAALRLARAVNYVNAGTVEFLLDGAGQFYFLEMNTRIQVEHPVTESVTGLNLIALQLQVSMGAGLPFAQSDVRFSEHAIEARLCAEDPGDGYRPQTGAFSGDFSGSGLRVDAGPARAVSGHYDSMLAKFVAHGRDRDDARRRLIAGLARCRIGGVRTNRAQLIEVLSHKEFAAGATDIGWLTRLGPPQAPPDHLAEQAAQALAGAQGPGWSSAGARRSLVAVAARGRTHHFALNAAALTPVDAILTGTGVHVFDGAQDELFEDVTYAAPARSDGAGSGEVRAPMAGRIADIAVAPGARVTKGALIAILESMKMEHEIRCAVSGVITEISTTAGAQVSAQHKIATITPDEIKTDA